jgi:hypothetical protein
MFIKKNEKRPEQNPRVHEQNIFSLKFEYVSSAGLNQFRFKGSASHRSSLNRSTPVPLLFFHYLLFFALLYQKNEKILCVMNAENQFEAKSDYPFYNRL